MTFSMHAGRGVGAAWAMMAMWVWGRPHRALLLGVGWSPTVPVRPWPTVAVDLYQHGRYVARHTTLAWCGLFCTFARAL